MKKNTSTLWMIYFAAVLFLFLLNANKVVAQNSVEDSLVLVTFYNATGGDNWYDNENWLVSGQPIDTWSGVKVDSTGRVYSLSLRPHCYEDWSFSNNLIGEIPPELGNLQNLQYLELIGNPDLTGPIPPELGNLSNLLILNLNNNKLSGSIPPELGNLANLEQLLLSDEVVCCTGAPTAVVQGSGNMLTGSIPSELGNLSNLIILDLCFNFLSGEIPPELGSLSSLNYLYLESNNLTGEIPSELGNLSNLQWVRLSSNDLTGEIPPELGNLSNVIYLFLSSNNLTGEIPAELGNLSSLYRLELSSNNLIGEIPSELGNLISLEVLNLSLNNLTGEIPPELGELPNLFGLFLSDNQLQGFLPPELADLLNIRKIKLNNNQLSGCFPVEYNVFCGIEKHDFSGNPNLPGGGDFDSFCYGFVGACDHSLGGQVVLDENENCAIEITETRLKNWMIKAAMGEDEYFCLSKSNGVYGINLPVGTFEIDAIPPNPLWEENCNDGTTLMVESEDSTYHIDFFGTPIVDCPYMTVDISTTLLRRCFDNVYYLSCCNNGTVAAENAFVEVTFDDLIIMNSSSIPIESQTGNTYTFDLGNIGVSECKEFSIDVYVSCEAINGQTLCAEAHVYPDSICIEDPDWSGAIVETNGECSGENVVFEIRNSGENDMVVPGTYLIIEDGVVLMADPMEFMLNSGENIEIEYPANGSTYVIQATQVDNYYNQSAVTSTVEACGTNNDGAFSMGYVTQFAENDAEPFVSIDCQEVIGSFDPNDKNGYPKGYGDEHFIVRDQAIEYRIRFQNTGTDTAFTVVVKDVISPSLDIATLELGVSSHPYVAEILGDTLRFTFNDIYLPDSSVNEAASHGFVKFKIGQKADLLLGTVIHNTAGIYFDYNDVVLTNTTTHVLLVNFLNVVAVETLYNSNLSISANPNPFDGYTTVTLDGVSFKEGKWTILDVYGRLIKRQTFTGETVQINSEGLSAGTYILKISLDGMPSGTGKIIVR